MTGAKLFSQQWETGGSASRALCAVLVSLSQIEHGWTGSLRGGQQELSMMWLGFCVRNSYVN